MKQLFKQIWLIAIALVVGMPAFAETPAINVGEAEVAINIIIPESAGVKLDNPTGLVINLSMFESATEYLWDEKAEGTLLTYDGKSIVGKVPMELNYQWFNIILKDEATEMNLNLLAAQSYVNQIVEDNKPLTAAQIENVKQGFNNDLGKIILNRNEKK